MKRPTSSGGGGTYNSYQHGSNTSNNNINNSNSNNYQPPVFYAADQTQTLAETTTTFYQADETAGHVLSTLQAQRQQIGNAHDQAKRMKDATDAAQRELELLHRKYRAKNGCTFGWSPSVYSTRSYWSVYSSAAGVSFVENNEQQRRQLSLL
jgi:hypothetical protein